MRKFKLIELLGTAVIKIKKVFKNASSVAELQLDSFIFSKEKQPSARVVITGTGLCITLSLKKLAEDGRYFQYFSAEDKSIIVNVLNDIKLFTAHMLSGNKVMLASKSFNREDKGIKLTISIIDSNDQNIEFEVDPSDIARNKFLIQLFNNKDAFAIGYAAAESRLRTEKEEMKKAKIIQINSSEHNANDKNRVINSRE